MTNAFRYALPGIVVLALSAIVPGTTLARGSAAAACPTPKTHTLPKSSGNTSPRVIGFGVKGGSLRPWTIKLMLDGSITASLGNTNRQQLGDPENSLKGLLALADAEGFFSLKKAIGCAGSAGNPDASSRYISIHTATGTKRVQSFGSCASTAKFDQIFALLEGATGVGA